jgi:hypothetical protein
MKCEHCGGENVGPDLVCNTCGTHARPGLRVPDAALGDMPELPARSFTRTEFHTISGVPLETDVLPMPPLPTASAATPLRPAEPRPPRPSGIEPPPPGMPGSPHSAPFRQRPGAPQQAISQQLFPGQDDAPPPWANPQIEYEARESSNLHRAVIGLMVAGAVAFGFSMDWWTGVGRTADTVAANSAAKANPRAKIAEASAPRDAAPGGEKAPPASLLESERPGTVALALPMLESETPPAVAVAQAEPNPPQATTPAISDRARSAVAADTDKAEAPARAAPSPPIEAKSVGPTREQTAALAPAAPPRVAAVPSQGAVAPPQGAVGPSPVTAPGIRQTQAAEVPAPAVATRAPVQTLDVRRAQQQAALKHKSVAVRKAPLQRRDPSRGRQSPRRAPERH